MNATIWFHPQLELVYSRLKGELTREGIIMTNACQWLSIPPETDFRTGDPLIVECGRNAAR